MAANSAIEWTDQTWNPVVGCSKVSPGCAHCYAETMAARLKAMALQDIADGKDPGRKRHYIEAIDDKGRWSGKMIPVPEALSDPLSWKKPRQVFVNSMSDLFHESVPFDFIDGVFGVMAYCRKHTFQILTKRGRRMSEYFADRSLGDVYTNILRLADQERAWEKSPHDNLRSLIRLIDSWELQDGYQSEHSPPKTWPLPNVWLGVSCEDQQRADERIPWLLKTPAAVRFLSCEPLLGAINLTDACGSPGYLDWIIVGGESGPGSRPCNVEWIRSIVAQCKAAGVACFVKQLGAKPVNYAGEQLRFLDKKGGDIETWPHELQVREFPQREAVA